MPETSIFASDSGNLSMPAATVIPVVPYPDVPAAAAWLCRAFGFSERLRIGTHRIQISAGDGAIVVAQGPTLPAGADCRGFSVMVRVSNVDRHFEVAKEAGAKTLGEPTSFPFGERQYTAVDLAGHAWTFSQTEANVDPGLWGGKLVCDSERATTDPSPPFHAKSSVGIQITESTDPKDLALVFDRLGAPSDPLLGEEPRGLCLIARSPEGVIVGGLVGKTGWQYLEVSHLWVDEPCRKSGFASELMHAAEAEAVRRGCQHARLDTFSFQGLGVYQKLGYSEFGRLSGYSGRFDRHFLYKALHPAAV